ncbi:MAG: hypothetical protein WD059_15135 [Balneolaceae bacterium]
MAKVKVEFEFELSTEDKDQLSEILECKHDQLDTKLSKYAKASMEEYIEMFLGRKVFTRGSDIHEYRLFLLLKHVFQGGIPDDQTITRLFQTTISRSRSLHRTVLSKFQYELNKSIEISLKSTIKKAKQKSGAKDNDPYFVIIGNKSILESLNLMLAKIDGTLLQISLVSNSGSYYEIKKSSYNAIKKELGV